MLVWKLARSTPATPSPTLSFKLNGYSPSIIAAGGSYFYLTGGGAFISASAYAILFQSGIGGAVCFNFKSSH